MMIRRIYYTLVVLLLFAVQTAQAQDPHFSQAVNAPVLLNPALTGVMATDARIFTNYRTQWSSVATPFQTMAVAVDFSPMRYILNTDDILGIGAYIIRDKAGSTELSNTQVQMTLAYSKSLNGQGNNYLSIGAQVGYAQQSLNFQNLTFDNQIEGNVLNTSLSTGENFLFNNVNYWDVSAGIGWAYTPERSQSYYFGGSVYHLNEPNLSFIGGEDDFDLLHRKYTAYAGCEVRLSYLISIMPRAFFLKQGAAKELTFGSLVKFNVDGGGSSRNRNDSSAIILGTLYRMGDALVVITRYDFQRFGISFSYDVNLSPLNTISQGYGAIEAAVYYKTSLSQRQRKGRPLSCPNF